jgi:protein-tyrosine-phosphatase
MARAVFAYVYPHHHADSAGTRVDRPGESLLEYAIRNRGHSFVLPVMDGFGCDLRHVRRRQLNAEDLQGFDVVVSMAESATEPTWLTSNPAYVRWEVPDPGGRSLAEVRRTRNSILARVQRDFAQGVSSACQESSANGKPASRRGGRWRTQD